MRFAVGAMLFEGNTFSPVIARRADFASKYLVHGDAVLTALKGTGTEIGGAIDEAISGGDTLLPLIATHGGAGGRVASDFTRELADSLLGRLGRLTGIDGIYLALHGAYVSEDSLDVDGEVLARVRATFPHTPIVASCDLHAYVTDRMLANCDALTGYQHYPHDDTYETGRRGLAMLREICDGRLVPELVRCRIPLIAAAQNQRTKGTGPMTEVRALAQSLIAGHVRDVAHFCVQPWIDGPGLGFTAVVTANRDAQAGLDAAETVARAMWERRERYRVSTVSPDKAIARSLGVNGMVVLADASDCVGGGASGDSAIALAALLRHAPLAPATIHIADDVTAAAARRAGIGARLRVAIGNRRDPAYGPPLEVDAEVVHLPPDGFVYAGGLMRGVRAETGASAVLRVGAVEVLVTANACYEYADEAFRAAGIDTRTKKFVVVKNPMNYQQAYADAASMLILDTPGPTTPNLASLDWRHIDRPLFPVDADTRLRLEFWTRTKAWTTNPA